MDRAQFALQEYIFFYLSKFIKNVFFTKKYILSFFKNTLKRTESHIVAVLFPNS